jgi:hypothetical protein
MAKITETRKPMMFLLSNVNITIEPIYSQTLPPASPFTCATAVTFSSHLFSSIALVKRSGSKCALTCFNLPIVSEFYNPAINHIVLQAYQSLNADQLPLSCPQLKPKNKHAAQNSPHHNTQVIRKKGTNADKIPSPFLQTASAFHLHRRRILIPLRLQH